MPRRPPKNGYNIKPGQVLNPSGRPVGAGNKMVITEKVREAFAQLLENNIGELEGWLHALAKKNPEKALDIWVRISERFVPSLQRTDHHIEGSGVMIPIQINLPQFNVPTSIGEGASAEISASSPIATLQPPAQPGMLGEGTPSTDVDMEFTIPKFELSPNILRDIQEISEAAPTGGDGPGGL